MTGEMNWSGKRNVNQNPKGNPITVVRILLLLCESESTGECDFRVLKYEIEG